MKYILETKKLMSVANPGGATRTLEVEPYTISVESFNVTGRSLSASVRISQPGRRFDSTIVASDFSVVDKEGKSYALNGYISSRTMGGNSVSSTYQLNLVLPEKAEVTTFELTSAVDTEEIPIPFSFTDWAIK